MSIAYKSQGMEKHHINSIYYKRTRLTLEEAGRPYEFRKLPTQNHHYMSIKEKFMFSEKNIFIKNLSSVI